MADEIHDLIVSVTPSGVSDTTEQLGDLGDEFGDAAEQAGDSADFLSDFAEQFEGAAIVVLAGLATVTAGLLSQVPVIQEAMGGLFAIFDALTLRLDERLRPALGGVTVGLFDVADAVLTAEGRLGNIVDIVLVAAAAFGVLAGVVAAYAVVQALAATAIGATVIAAAPLIAVLGLIALAIGILAVAWQENWFNIRGVASEAVAFLTTKFEQLQGFLSDVWDDPIGAGFDFVEFMLTAFARLVTGLDALTQKMTARIVTGFETQFALIINSAKQFANSLVGIIETAVNDSIMAIPEGFRRGLSPINIDRPFDPRSRSDIIRAGQARLRRRDRAIDRQEGRRNDQLERQIAAVLSRLEQATRDTTVEVDGREVARSQERFFGAGASGMGRTARTR